VFIGRSPSLTLLDFDLHALATGTKAALAVADATMVTRQSKHTPIMQ